ncbi:MAG: methionine biosynthesis protein MetW [Rhodospirillales bacterium]
MTDAERPLLANLRPDLALVAGMVEPGARVLDIGCEDGALLEALVREKGVTGRGLELSQAGVNASVKRGLSVVQGDADSDLAHYPDRAFDFVVLSQTLPATRSPDQVLSALVRIGERAIVSFANFGHWRVRLHLLLRGRMPVTNALSRPWYATDNIHLCTICDFIALCEELGIGVERAVSLDLKQRPRAIVNRRYANIFGETGLFLLSKR